jgi:hypothetical protein
MRKSPAGDSGAFLIRHLMQNILMEKGMLIRAKRLGDSLSVPASAAKNRTTGAIHGQRCMPALCGKRRHGTSLKAMEPKVDVGSATQGRGSGLER